MFIITKEDDAGRPVSLTQKELTAPGSNASYPTLEGWTQAAGYRVALAVAVQTANGDTLAGTIPTLHVTLSKGPETLELDVADVRGKAARAWADALAAQSDGRTENLGLGVGYVKGASALVDQGQRLVRLVYSDSADAQNLSDDQARDRLLDFEGRVRGLANSARNT